MPFAATTIAITLEVTASHSLVPPTPGPIAAAGIIGADLGMVIFWGFIVSATALIPGSFYAKYFTSRIKLVPQFAEEEKTTEIKKYPSAGKSFLPVVVPLLLIVLASIANYPTHPLGENAFTSIILFIGSPVIALLLGAFLSFSLPGKFDKTLLSSTGWFGEAVLIAAPIIFITGAGGVFGKMLQNSGIAELVKLETWKEATGALLLPFLMALALKSAQGSSTVALVTTASIIAPLLGTLGLESGHVQGVCRAGHRGRSDGDFSRQRQLFLGHDPAHGHECEAGVPVA